MNTVILIALIFNCIAVLTCGYATVQMIRYKENMIAVFMFALATCNLLLGIMNALRLTGRF